MVGFNFRRVPALCLAKQLIEEGVLGELYHFRAIWSQDWLTDPKFPIAWRLKGLGWLWNTRRFRRSSY